MLDKDTAVKELTKQLAELAKDFLVAYGITLPPETDLVPFVQLGITQAMLLCEDDFAGEVAATINDIEQQPLMQELVKYRARLK